MSGSNVPVLVGEDDYFTPLIAIVLDPDVDPEIKAAFADFLANDLPNLDAWCRNVRAKVGGLYPSVVRTLTDDIDVATALKGADAMIVESMPVTKATIAGADRLVAVQRYGTVLRTIDTDACAAQGIKVLTLRRRANIAVAEFAFMLMLMLAKKASVLMGRISASQLAEAGFSCKPFDRRHTPNSNYPRVPGIRMLHGSTVGIIGLGEIGREIAQRANASGMHVLYHQRTRLAAADEAALAVTYVSLDDLLARSDWVIPHLPSNPSTRRLLGAPQLARMKRGAFIVNVSRADVIDRAALIDALKSGQLGGFALDPLYEEPGRDDDELLTFDNVILMPHVASQPRFNMLDDIEEIIIGLAREIGAASRTRNNVGGGRP